LSVQLHSEVTAGIKRILKEFKIILWTKVKALERVLKIKNISFFLLEIRPWLQSHSWWRQLPINHSTCRGIYFEQDWSCYQRRMYRITTKWSLKLFGEEFVYHPIRAQTL
jgi:hypothetical protein